MSKVNLRQELSDKKYDIRQHNEKSQNPETKLLMGYDDSVELKVLRNIGLDHNIRVVENLKSKNLTLENLDKEYGGETYSMTMIESLALRYGLQFGPTTKYKGLLDSVTALHIKTFMDTHKLSYETAHFIDQFFILAPGKVFEKQTDSLASCNPMLFYRIPGNNGETHFRLIYRWGEDFNTWQFVKGFPFKDFTHFCFTLSFMCFSFLYLLFIAIDPDSGFWLGLIFTSLFGSIVGTIIAYINRDSSWLTTNNWKQYYKDIYTR
jgi:hypothetical protein